MECGRASSKRGVGWEEIGIKTKRRYGKIRGPGKVIKGKFWTSDNHDFEGVAENNPEGYAKQVSDQLKSENA